MFCFLFPEFSSPPDCFGLLSAGLSPNSPFGARRETDGSNGLLSSSSVPAPAKGTAPGTFLCRFLMPVLSLVGAFVYTLTEIAQNTHHALSLGISLLGRFLEPPRSLLVALSHTLTSVV